MNGRIPFRKVDLWLQSFQTVWLSTYRQDGDTHCVPVHFWWDHETKRIYFITRRKALKAQHLQQNPSVLIHAGDGNHTLILQGCARHITGEADRQQIDSRWQAKYRQAWQPTPATIRQADTLLYCIDIQQVRVWEYGSTATRTDWDFTPGEQAVQTGQAAPVTV